MHQIKTSPPETNCEPSARWRLWSRRRAEGSLCFVLALLFLLHSKHEIFHSPNRCVFPLKERDDREQNVQQLLDQLRVALIEFPLFDTIDELLDLGRISGGDVIVVFHRRQSRRSSARQKRTPRLERIFSFFTRAQCRDTMWQPWLSTFSY